MKKVYKIVSLTLAFLVDVYAAISLYSNIINKSSNQLLISILFTISAISITILLLLLQEEKYKMFALEQLSYAGKNNTIRMLLCYYALKANSNSMGDFSKRNKCNRSLIKQASFSFTVGEENGLKKSNINYKHTFKFYFMPRKFDTFILHDIGFVENSVRIEIDGLISTPEPRFILDGEAVVNKRNLNLEFIKYRLPPELSKKRILSRPQMKYSYNLYDSFDYNEEEVFVIFPANYGLYLGEIDIKLIIRSPFDFSVVLNEFNISRKNQSGLSKTYDKVEQSTQNGLNKEYNFFVNNVNAKKIYFLSIKKVTLPHKTGPN